MSRNAVRRRVEILREQNTTRCLTARIEAKNGEWCCWYALYRQHLEDLFGVFLFLGYRQDVSKELYCIEFQGIVGYAISLKGVYVT